MRTAKLSAYLSPILIFGLLVQLLQTACVSISSGGGTAGYPSVFRLDDEDTQQHTVILKLTDSQTSKALHASTAVLHVRSYASKSNETIVTYPTDRKNTPPNEFTFASNHSPSLVDVYVITRGYHPAAVRAYLARNSDKTVVVAKLEPCPSCWKKPTEASNRKFRKAITAAKRLIAEKSPKQSAALLEKVVPVGVTQSSVHYFHLARAYNRFFESEELKVGTIPVQLAANYFSYLFQPHRLTALYNQACANPRSLQAFLLLDVLYHKTTDIPERREFFAALIKTDKDLAWLKEWKDVDNRISRWHPQADSSLVCVPDYNALDSATDATGRCAVKHGACPHYFRAAESKIPLASSEECKVIAVDCG